MGAREEGGRGPSQLRGPWGQWGSPLVHEVGEHGRQQAEQHDSGAGVHHGVQELPWVLGRGQDTLQILQDMGARAVRGLLEADTTAGSLHPHPRGPLGVWKHHARWGLLPPQRVFGLRRDARE